MNQAHFHLLINHLPIMGTVVGIIVLLGGYVLNNQTVKRTALGIFILSSIGIIPARYTGEGAEDIVEDLPGISRKLIHNHEDFAALFGWSLLVVAILSLIAIYLDLKNKNTSKIFYLLTMVLAIITIVLAKQTATSGGEIRHTEIRNNNPSGEMPGVDSIKEEDKDH